MSHSEQPIQAIGTERASQIASRGITSRPAETTAVSPFRNPVQAGPAPGLATSRGDSVQLSSSALRNLADGIDDPCGTKPHQPFPWPPVGNAMPHPPVPRPLPPQPPVGNAMPHPPVPRPPIGNPVQQPSLGTLPGVNLPGLPGGLGIGPHFPGLPDLGDITAKLPGLGGTTPPDDYCGTHPRPFPFPLGLNPVVIPAGNIQPQAPWMRAL